MNKRILYALLTGTWALSFVTAPLAQPIKNVILDSATVYSENGCANIRVNFNFPIRYKQHFPRGGGDDLRIQLMPMINGAEDNKLAFIREAVRTKNEDLLPLVNIIYDGEATTGPYLVLHFNQVVKFNVHQGRDFRSILINVFNSDATSASGQCLPTKTEH